MEDKKSLMDEYGTFQNTPEDLDLLATHMNSKDCFTFTYSADRYTAHILTIAKSENVGGPLPWGGSIAGMHMVSVRRRGTEFFNFHGPNPFHPNYIAEKLGLQEGDAEQICALMNALKERMK